MTIVIICKKCGRVKMCEKWAYPTNEAMLKLYQGLKNKEAGLMNMKCPICIKKEKGKPPQ